jgi:hypothetical protein
MELALDRVALVAHGALPTVPWLDHRQVGELQQVLQQNLQAPADLVPPSRADPLELLCSMARVGWCRAQ